MKGLLSGGDKPQLGAIEEDDEEEEEGEADDGDSWGGGGGAVEHVPQCFSHFTYVATEGKKLVCDLQVSIAGNHALAMHSWPYSLVWAWKALWFRSDS